MALSIVLVPGMSSIGTVFYEPLKRELGTFGFSRVVVVDLSSVDSVARIEGQRASSQILWKSTFSTFEA